MRRAPTLRGLPGTAWRGCASPDLLLHSDGLAARGGAPADLVQVDSADQHHPDGHILPVRVDSNDHEATRQRGWDQHTDHAPGDTASATEQARAADDRRRNGA